MSWSSTITAISPLRWFRCGDASGTTATDSSGSAVNGTYVGSPTLGVASLVADDTSNTAIRLNGSSQYINAGVLGTLGSSRSAGMSFMCVFRCTNPNQQHALIGVAENLSTGASAITIRLNATAAGTTAFGFVRVNFADNSGTPKAILGQADCGIGILDGAPHLIFVTVNPSTNTITVDVDGVSKTVTYTLQQTPNTFVNWTQSVYIGAQNNAGTAASYADLAIDEVAICSGVVNSTDRGTVATAFLATAHTPILTTAPTCTVTSTTARIGVRASGACTLAVKYSTASDLSGSTTTSGIAVTSTTDFATKFDITGLTAGTTYYYDILVDGASGIPSPYASLATFAASPTSVKFAFGSCLSHSTATGVSAEDLTNQVPTDSAFLLHLGDTIYADEDPPTATTLAQYRVKHRSALANDRFARNFYAMVKRTPLFTAWDDHELVNNYDDGTGGILYAPAKQAFNEYHGLANPSTDPLYYTFNVGSVGFFVADTRSYRSTVGQVDNASKTCLGATQLEALKAWLVANNATYRIKFICVGGPMHGSGTAADAFGGAYDGSQSPTGANGYRTERNAIWDFIDAQGITGVVALSGDQHYGSSWVTSYGGRNRYEFNAGPFNQGVTSSAPTGSSPAFSYHAGRALGVVTVDLSAETVVFQLYGISGSLGNTYKSTIAFSSIDSGLGSADTTAPTTPTLTAESGNGHVLLSWTAATDAKGLKGYLLKRDGVTIYDGSALSYLDEAAINGTSYSYTVTAYDWPGNTAVSSAVAVTPGTSSGSIFDSAILKIH